MQIKVRAFDLRHHKKQRMRVYLDGHILHTHTFAEAWQWETVPVRLPTEVDPTRPHTITFRFDDYRRVARQGYGDPRLLCAGFETIEFLSPPHE